MPESTETTYQRMLSEAAHERARRGLVRSLRPRSADDQTLDLASNDYLGLARDPRVIAGAVAAAEEWGGGATASRLVSGTTQLHADFEQTLAHFVGIPAALVFSSGYLANLGAITALSDPHTLVVSDRQNHASLIDAVRLSRAEVQIVDHCDVGAVEEALRDRASERALVVTDAVFSVDGNAAPLRELYRLCQDHDAMLIVDEAHSIGVIGDGRGLVASCSLPADERIVVTMTMSKSFGSQGGAVLGSPELIDHLVNTARPFIFDTGLNPAALGAAAAALQIIQDDPHLTTRALANAQSLQQVGMNAGLDSRPTQSAVTSLLVPQASEARRLSDEIAARGISVGCFRPPSVPDEFSRLRLTGKASLTSDDIDHFANVLDSVL